MEEYKADYLEPKNNYMTYEEVVALVNSSLTNLSQPMRVQTNYLQSGNFVSGSSGWKMDALGNLEANNGNFRGDITGATGIFSGTVSVGSINIGGDDATSAHIDTDGNQWWGASVANKATAPARVSNAGVATFSDMTITGGSVATSTLNGLVALANENIAAQGWTNTCVFSATDYRIVAWAAGAITTAAGTVYTIVGGNTGNMAAQTYIYLDIAVSTTVLQTTTTAATAIGSGKILVATAVNNSDTTSKAQYQVFGGVGGVRLFVDNISANSASTNEFVSNSAQLADLVVTNAKINSLSVDKLTSDTIASKQITLGLLGTTDDCYINSGKTDFTNAQTGFILGVDNSDSDLPKFYIGTSTSYFNFDGVNSDATGFRYIQQFTAGETISAGKIVCYKKAILDSVVSADCSTSTDAPTTNFDSGDPASGLTYKCGTSAGINYKLFFGFNTANSQPDKVVLRFYGNVSEVGTLEAYRITADWNETTITNNTIPAMTAANATGSPTLTLTSTGFQWIEMDITNIVRGEMQATGDWTMARGVMIYFNGGTGYISSIRSKEYTTDTTQRPFLRITKGIDLEGSGSLYIADNTDLNLSRRIAGINLTAGTATNSFNVQFGGVASGLSGLTAGREYYLSTAGAIAVKSFALNSNQTKIGTALSTTTLKIEIDEERFLWKSAAINVIADGTTNLVFAPIEANECVIYYTKQATAGGTPEMSGTLILKRNGLNTAAARDNYASGNIAITYVWDDTNNKITITNTSVGSGTHNTNSTFYFYK